MKTKLLLLVFAIVFSNANLQAAGFTVDGITYSITSATAPYTVAVVQKSPVYTGNVSIPASVSYNSISYSVTSISNQAFYNCTGLTSVTITNLVTSIGDNAFRNCTSLSSVTIPNSVTSTGTYAFYGCTGLTSVTIGNSVTSIGGSTFSGCSGLTSVTVPNSVTYIGISAFSDCTGLTSVTIGNSVTYILSAAFANCSKLNAVTIPSSVTSIGASTFQQCTSLASVTISNSVTSIGDYAFYGCSSLTSIYANNPTPVDLSGSRDVFYNVNKTTCTLYVPIGSKSLYTAANQWKDFINIVEHIVTGINTVSALKLNIRLIGRTMEIDLPEASAPVLVVDISGRQLYNGTPSGSTLTVTLPQTGIYLVRIGNKTTKLVAR
jgi:hypothetical protein